MRLKTFNVYVHPQGSFTAIKNGLCWPAFVFGVAWVLYNRLWLLGVSIFALLMCAIVVEVLLEEFMALKTVAPDIAVSLLYTLHITGHGNAWLQRRLRKRGYIYTATVKAESSRAARSVVLHSATPSL